MVILEAISGFNDAIEPVAVTAEARLQIAQSHFQDRPFSRKDYIKCIKTISTATASRDLQQGVEDRLLLKQGDNAQTRYAFKIE